MILGNCGQCGEEGPTCANCHNCQVHCNCACAWFDYDELGLDPETDNTPEDPSRNA